MDMVVLSAEGYLCPPLRWGEVLIWLVAAYLVGAIPFSLILGYLLAGVDIRQHGSGNIGATNLARVVGWKYFPLAFALDSAKGAMPVAAWMWRAGIFLPGTMASQAMFQGGLTNVPNAYDLAALLGLAALAGHLWPIYLRFRGGKGVATGAGVVAVLMPLPTAVAALTWGVVAWLSRYVSLSSLCAAFALVVSQAVYTWPSCFAPAHRAATSLALIGAGLVFLRHRENIVRLWQGRESKLGQQTPLPTYCNSPTKISFSGDAPGAASPEVEGHES
ncbi:MAG: glycerol-3-phosphate 1-O-acyltransferase PlsY [Gemmatales bacterium]|nr:glycerol-3-phosphate 1-O-acyltransferase PlsY [Gemmatales bacterium]MDW7995927.1 glycerol-3-phosphate 1-O-acyltransferase PlsY [Gemmatales bacterium]